MDSNIYIEIDGEPVGPLTRQEVQQKLLNDECTLDYPAWTEGNENNPRTLRKVMGMSSGSKALKSPTAESDAEKRRRQAAAEIARIAKREEKKRDVETGKKSSNLGGLLSLVLILLMVGGGLFYYFTVIAPSRSASDAVAAGDAGEGANAQAAPAGARPSVPTSPRREQAVAGGGSPTTTGSSASTGQTAGQSSAAPPSGSAINTSPAVENTPAQPTPAASPPNAQAQAGPSDAGSQEKLTAEIQKLPLVNTADNEGAFAVQWKGRKVVIFNGALLLEEPTLPSVRDPDQQQNFPLDSALLVPQTEIAVSPLPSGYTLDGPPHPVPEPGLARVESGQSLRVGWDRQARVVVEDVDEHRIIIRRSRYAKPGAPVKLTQDDKEYIIGIVAGFEMRPELTRLQKPEVPRGRILVWRLDTARQFVPYDPQKFERETEALEEAYELTNSLMTIGFGRREEFDMGEMSRHVENTKWPSSLRSPIERFQNSAKGRVDRATQKRIVVDLLKAIIGEARRDIASLNRNVSYGPLNVRVNSESRAREQIIANLQPAVEN